MKNGAAKTDGTLKEFERRDLGGDIEAGGSAILVRPQMMTSIRLDPALIKRLRQRAARLGVGYQTLLKMIVTKHADDEL
ncbi:MAG: hypothetical protein HY270_16585 [Deltaproteobacteria bacterium]|nr:hypothetical protein [Deltaproteobacteria bacterium]